MNKTIVVLALLLIGIAPTRAVSEDYKFNTGYDLYHALLLIENPQDTKDLMFSVRAMGYISGFVDGIILTQNNLYNLVLPKKLMSEKERIKWAKEMNFNRLNIPKEGIAVGQGVLIFQKWAKNHPEELNNTMRLCLWLSLAETYGWK